jgi:1-acyl-sn-glycerol-3-phosphate acyltransferase
MRRPEQGSGWFYRLISGLVRLVSDLLFRVEVIGREHLPDGQPMMVLPTHTSYLDPPIVGSNLPRGGYYLARDSLFKVPLLGLALRNLQTYPIRRGASDREALRACRTVLQGGWPLMFFPEGTRSRDGKLGPLQGGFALILDGLNLPYVPVVVQDTYHVLPRGRALPRLRKVHVYVGAPRMLPTRSPGEKTREYVNRCIAQLEADYHALGAV